MTERPEKTILTGALELLRFLAPIVALTVLTDLTEFLNQAD